VSVTDRLLAFVGGICFWALPLIGCLSAVVIAGLNWVRSNRRSEKALVGIMFPLIVASFLLTSLQIRSDRQQKADGQKLLEQIARDLGNSDQVEKYLKLAYRDAYRTSEADADRWYADLKSSLPQRRDEMQSAEKESLKKGDRLRLLWQPVLDSILAQVDSRVAKLKDDGLIKSIAPPRPTPIIDTEDSSESSSPTYLAREVICRSDFRVAVIVLPARPLSSQPAKETSIEVWARRGRSSSKIQIILKESGPSSLSTQGDAFPEPERLPRCPD